MLAVLVPMLRRDDELELSDAEAALLVRMSAATIDRRLGAERFKFLRQWVEHENIWENTHNRCTERLRNSGANPKQAQRPTPCFNSANGSRLCSTILMPSLVLSTTPESGAGACSSTS